MTDVAPPLPLTDEQHAAVTAPAGPLLLVAGAGSGKTSVMARRIAWLIDERGVEPHAVLGLTFTNKAAAELKKRVVETLGRDADVAVSTYHGFGAGLVAEHGLLLGLDPGTQVLGRAQAWQLLHNVFDEFHFEARSATMPGFIVDVALQLASRCADHLVDIADVERDCGDIAANGLKEMRDPALKRLELCQVVKAYERRKRELNLIDYGDQIRLAVRLFAEHPHLAVDYRQLHPFVLLDEYQDTNYAQRVLLQHIYPAGSAITAVGDDMQSIYAFRGAHLRNLLDFGEHFGPAAPVRLQTNFRSGPEVVTLANRIQGQVRGALPKELSAKPGAPPATIECFLASDAAEEAEEIAREIEARGEPWGHNAVLCRKRRLIPAIAAALERHKVPVDVVGTSGLLDRPEITDLVAWLEVLSDLSATVPLLRILEGPRYRIGRRDLAALARHARAQARAEGGVEGEEPFVLAEALGELDQVADLSGPALDRLQAFCRERSELASAALRLSVLDLAEAVIRRTGLWHHTQPVGRENLLRFLDLCERFAPIEGDPGLHAFLDYLRLIEESEEDVAEAHPTGDDAVRVMTIHQAKGLEFPNVYVPGLAGRTRSRIFPDDRANDNALTNNAALPWWIKSDDDSGLPHWKEVAKVSEVADELRTRKREEEWRLLYVACTRAQEWLVCSAAHWYAGPAEPQGPSEFYDFVSGQADLVRERFRHDPPEIDPAVAERARRKAAAARPAPSGPATGSERPHQQVLLGDADLGPTPPRSRAAPTSLSVTSLVSYARCPRQFYWSVVRPLPRRSSPAALLGTEVHRWIELRADRQLVLLEPDRDPLAGDGGPEPAGDGGPEPAGDAARQQAPAAGALQASFLAGPFADRDPERVEAPFQLLVGAHVIRGRIDAVYRREGRLELVDFKTGRTPAEGDAGADVQLDLYALAAVDTWGADPDELRTTYCYLRAGQEPHLVTREWDAAAIARVRAGLAGTLDRLAAQRYPATAGAWCQRCDYLAFCPPGRAAAPQPRVPG